jgi:hypothetical protein
MKNHLDTDGHRKTQINRNHCIIKLRKSNGTLSNVFRPPHPPLSPDYGGEDKGEGV